MSSKVLGSRATDTHKIVIDLLVQRGAMSRLQLSQETGLSKPTISSVIAELIKNGIVREVGLGNSTGGRKPVLLRLGGEGSIVAGFELDSSMCHAIIVDLDGHILRQQELPVTTTCVEALLALVEQGIKCLLSDRNPGALIGCGVAVPGLIDTFGDSVTYADSLGWDSIDLRCQLQNRLKLPVRMTDRGKAATLGTLWLRGRESQGDLAYIYLGTGVGGGLIMGNSLRLGASHTAGEIGHMTVLPDGPLCKCGNRGCLETLVSGPAIAMRARVKIRTGQETVLSAWILNQNLEAVTAKMVSQAAGQGDPLALEVLDETAMYLGIAIANVVNLINPQTIILGGPVSRWNGRLLPAVAKEVEKRALPVAVRAMRLVSSEEEDVTVPLGAAALILQEAGKFLT